MDVSHIAPGERVETELDALISRRDEDLETMRRYHAEHGTPRATLWGRLWGRITGR